MITMKIVLASILVLIVNSSAMSLLNKYAIFSRKPAVDAKAAAKQIRKTKVINIPAVENKEVKGYFLIQFAVVTIGKESTKANMDDLAEIYVLDEALTKIYGNGNTYGVGLVKSKVSELAPEILAAVQSKMGNDSVKEVLVHEFTYIPRADVR
jgi:hypothetical protein